MSVFSRSHYIFCTWSTTIYL